MFKSPHRDAVFVVLEAARVRVIVRPKNRVRVISSPHRDAVFVVLEAAGRLIEGAQRGTPRAEAQQLTHPCDLRAEHLGIREAGVEFD